nr:MAG TPA: hypothetical protein [Bacteriophage sp.]
MLNSTINKKQQTGSRRSAFRSASPSLLHLFTDNIQISAKRTVADSNRNHSFMLE